MAAIESERQLTDRPFPAGSHLKQFALLLCDQLAEVRASTWSELRRTTRDLLAHHERHWNRSPDDPAVVESTLTQAAALLAELDLVSASADGLRARPMCARFRAPEVREAGIP